MPRSHLKHGPIVSWHVPHVSDTVTGSTRLTVLSNIRIAGLPKDGYERGVEDNSILLQLLPIGLIFSSLNGDEARIQCQDGCILYLLLRSYGDLLDCPQYTATHSF